jgi:hypothetical protein
LEDMDAEVEINTVCETEYQNVSQREWLHIGLQWLDV